MSIAEIIGTGPHLSPLLRKATKLGFGSADERLRLAVKRGCHHYSPSGWSDDSVTDPGLAKLSDEELAISLITPGSSGGPQHIRCAAQLMSRPGLNPERLAMLAKMERCSSILRYIAETGLTHDPAGTEFWKSIQSQTGRTIKLAQERLPHPDRFMIVPGWSPRSRPAQTPYWLRPS